MESLKNVRKKNKYQVGWHAFVFRWHYLSLKKIVNFFEILFHVSQRLFALKFKIFWWIPINLFYLATNWTLVGTLNVTPITILMNAMSALLCDIKYILIKRKNDLDNRMLITMKMTVLVEVNIYSKQTGQLLSKFLSIHLWRSLRLNAMQTLQVEQWK